MACVLHGSDTYLLNICFLLVSHSQKSKQKPTAVWYCEWCVCQILRLVEQCNPVFNEQSINTDQDSKTGPPFPCVIGQEWQIRLKDVFICLMCSVCWQSWCKFTRLTWQRSVIKRLNLLAFHQNCNSLWNVIEGLEEIIEMCVGGKHFIVLQLCNCYLFGI